MSDKVKMRSLRAQACQTVDVSFNMPGVIAKQNFNHQSRKGVAQLGSRVSSFDLTANVYNILHEKIGTGDNEATFKYNSSEIAKLLSDGTASPYLFSLRNQTLAVSLDQAIAKRAISFFDKYKHIKELKDLMEKYLPESIASLEELQNTVTDRHTAIKSAYQADNLTGVVKTNISETLIPESSTETYSNPIAMVSSEFKVGTGPSDASITTNVYEKATDTLLSRQVTPMTGTSPMVNADEGWRRPAPGEMVTSSTTKTKVADKQVTTTKINSYSHPSLENDAQYHQSLVALYSQILSTKSANMRTPYLDKMFVLELESLDAEVRAIQLNFVHTYLIPPINGVITAIYKDIGEPVEPGEPVLRIENDEYLYLVGQVMSRKVIRAGATVTLSATLFEGLNSESIDGVIKVVRGHDIDSDEWEVVIETKNPKDSSGNLLIPLNYQFDSQRDQLEIH